MYSHFLMDHFGMTHFRMDHFRPAEQQLVQIVHAPGGVISGGRPATLYKKRRARDDEAILFIFLG